MAFKNEWKSNWEREWHVTECGTDWDLKDTDLVKFEGAWKPPALGKPDELDQVRILRLRTGEDAWEVWLIECTYVHSGGGQVHGTCGSTPFTINRVPGTLGTTTKLKGELIAAEASVGIISLFIKAVTKVFLWVAAALIGVANWLSEPNSGGRTGSWTAEDGGTGNKVLPLEDRFHGGARRRA